LTDAPALDPVPVDQSPPPALVKELAGWRRVAMKVLHAVEPIGHPESAIYGTLIAAAVLATKAYEGQSGAEVIESAGLLLLLFWIAHVYAGVLGERLQTHARPGWGVIVRAALADQSMLLGSLIPMVVFAVVRAAGASVNDSGLAALWFTVGLLVFWGLLGAVRGGARGLELFTETLVCALLGFGVVVLKIYIH
jgi:hypothetical protein